MRIGRFHVYDLIIVLAVAILLVRHMPVQERDPAVEAARAALRAGAQHFERGEYAEAADLFAEAALVFPDNTSPYFGRGMALFFLERFNEAERAFAEGVERTNDPYLLYWRYLADRRSGGEGDERLRRDAEAMGLEPGTWRGAVVQILLGEADEQKAVAMASRAPGKQRAGWLCEAYFYLGERKLLDGDAKAAEKLFRKALGTRATKYIEYAAAAEELRLLKRRGGEGGG